MLKIALTVPPARERAALVAIADGSNTIVEEYASATAHEKTAVQHRNPQLDPLRPGGHPPFGRYTLSERIATPQGAESEYGEALLLFQPLSGAALDAESYGRLGLLVYAGNLGRDRFLRRTQGGVRLSQRAMSAVLQGLGAGGDAELEIEALPAPHWWAFWRRRVEPPRLSDDPPRFDAPPFDEATLLTQLLRTSGRRSRPMRREDEPERRHDRDSSSTSSSASSADYRGGGGAGGGGGATGSWTDAPAAGRGPGVSAAGVILGAAGLAAAAAAASSTSVAQQSSDGSGDSSPSDSGDSSRSSDSGGTSSAGGTAY